MSAMLDRRGRAARCEECVARRRRGGVPDATPSTASAATPTTRRRPRASTQLKGRPRDARLRRSCSSRSSRALEMLGELPERERDALAGAAAGAGDGAARQPPRSASRRPAGSDPATLGLRVPRAAGARSRRSAASTAPVHAVERQPLRRARRAHARARCRASSATAPISCSTAASCPGTPSTVVDLRDFDAEGRWHVLREGAPARGRAVREAARSRPLALSPDAVRGPRRC